MKNYKKIHCLEIYSCCLLTHIATVHRYTFYTFCMSFHFLVNIFTLKPHFFKRQAKSQYTAFLITNSRRAIFMFGFAFMNPGITHA